MFHVAVMEVAMGKSAYFRVMFFLFWLGLLVGGAIRIYLKLFYTDVGTGFYTVKSSLILVFNCTLLAGAALLVLHNRLKTADNDYPLVREGRGLGALSMITGVALALYMLENTGWLFMTSHVGTRLKGYGLIFCGALGILAAMSFFALGMALVLGRRRTPNALVALVPAIWQLIILVAKFNSYTTLTTIADNLLIVLFMVFAAMFMIAHARIVCGLAGTGSGRKDGRNYMIPTGLITALMGLLLTIPNYVYMLIFRTGMPAQALGDMESLYVLFVSLYAFGAVVQLRRSIAVV